MKRKNKILFLSWFLIRKDFLHIAGISISLFLLLSVGFLPIMDMVFERILKKEGYSYLTSEVMLQFFTSRWMIFMFIIGVIIVGVILIFLQTLIIIQYVHIKRKQKKRIGSIIISTIQAVIRACNPKCCKIIIFNIVLAVFFNIPLVLWICMKLRMPRYAILYCLELYGFKIAMIVGCILLFIYCFQYMFTLHYYVIEKETYKESKKKSKRLLKNRRIKTLGNFVIWNVLFGIVILCVYIFLIIITSILILLFIPSQTKLLLFRTICDQINMNSVGFIGIFGILVNLAFTTTTYYHYKSEDKSGENQEYIDELPDTNDVVMTIRKRRIVVALVIMIGIDLIITYNTIKNGSYGSFRSFQPAKVTAHRGNSLEAPENTLDAVGLAIQSMADYVEIDVQETKDRKVVLMHDYNLKRTTGASGSVWDYTYKQLKGFDAGRWFHNEYINTTIPTLQQVIELTKGKIMLNIEIKSNDNMPHLEEDVVKLIERYDLTKQCVVTSSYESSLKKVKKLNADIKTGHILVSGYGNYLGNQWADFFSMTSDFVSESVVRKAHKLGKEIHVWTVNTEKETNRMMQLGVDNIITDIPAEVKNYLYHPKNSETLIDFISLAIK